MVGELIIHIGDRKTGSTSIQNSLSKGLYETNVPVVFPSGPPHRKLGILLEQSAKEAANLAQKLARQMLEADGGFGVISAERFEVVDPGNLAALFEGPFKPWRDNFRIIGYVRPHAQRLLSDFQERCKNGSFRGSLDDFTDVVLNKPLLQYAPRVAKWQSQFGDRYNVRPFIRSYLRNGDVVDDFFSFMLKGSSYSLEAKAPRNTSLSLEDLVLMRHLHDLLDQHGLKKKGPQVALGKQLGQILSDRPSQKATKLSLHVELAFRLKNAFQEDAAKLDAIAFQGTPMSDRLANLTDLAVSKPQSYEPEHVLSPEVLRLAANYSELLARIIDADSGHFHWAILPKSERSKKRPAPVNMD